jgi:uncharacterized protein YndB with AHSA1/START domain
MRASSSSTVAAPISHVWTVLADHEGMTGWVPGMKTNLIRLGNDDRNGVGAVRSIRVPLPLPAIVEEIVAFEPRRRLTYRALSGVPLRNYVGDVELRRVGGGTEITYSISADNPLPAVAKVLASTLLTLLRRQVNRTF